MVENKYNQSLDILQRYYNRLMNQLADEIIEKEREFDKGYLAMAEDLIFTYSNKLSCLSVIMSNLGHMAPSDNDGDFGGAGVAEIRCNRDEIGPRIQDWLEANPRANIVGFDVVPATNNGTLKPTEDAADVSEPKQADAETDAADASSEHKDEVRCILIFGPEGDS